MAAPINLPGYQLQSKFAEGGMASIYLGKQISLDRDVAVKILNPALLNRVDSLEQNIKEAFEAESVIISRLNHPYIVQVIDRGVTREGIPYFVMEYIKGVSLAKAISLDNLTTDQRYKLAIQVCQGIDYAHKNRVIHRDIKPDNILVDMQGNAKILDFGIAVFEQKRIDASIDEEKKAPSLIAGTARYMAPELMEGKALASVSSDIFSLGFVLYELFSGLPPSPAAVINYRPLHEINPKLPSKLDSLIQRCLSSKPDLRPSSVQEILHALLELSRGQHLGREQRLRAQQSIGKRSFELLDVLSETTKAATYLFEEKNNHTQVLVKKYQGHVHGFIENKRLMGLEHKHIVPIIGVSKNDRIFIVVTPYLPGGSLQQRMVRHFSLEEFAYIARQICSAMAFAHQNGIYHGCLNESCIWFDDSGAIQIADFAVHAEPHINQPNLDLHNAGLIFFRMLVGEEAVIKEGHLKMTEHFKQVPQRLQEMVMGMLGITSKSFSSFAEVQTHLDSVTDTLPTALFNQQERPAQAGRLKWLATGFLILALIAGGIVLFGIK